MNLKNFFQTLFLLLSAYASNALAEDVTLSAEEAKFIKTIIGKDKFLQELPKAQKQVAALNTILSAAPGPIKIALQWNKVAIAAWRQANSSLAQIKQASICQEIDYMIATSEKNSEFFEQLSSARGCQETQESQSNTNGQSKLSDMIASRLKVSNQKAAAPIVIYSAKIKETSDEYIISAAPCSEDILLVASKSQAEVLPSTGNTRTVRCKDGTQAKTQDISIFRNSTLSVLSNVTAEDAIFLAAKIKESLIEDSMMPASGRKLTQANRINNQSNSGGIQNVLFGIPGTPKLPGVIPEKIEDLIPDPRKAIPSIDGFNTTYPACIPFRQHNSWQTATAAARKGHEIGLYTSREQCRDKIALLAGALATELGSPELAPAILYGGDCACNWEFK